MKEKIKVLILEDLPSDAELAERELKTALNNYTLVVTNAEQGFIQALEDFKPDLVISDYMLPSFDGMKALQITRKEKEFIPFIVLTGSMNEETAVECMKAGADDYVIKEQIKHLGPAILNALDKKKIKQERKQAEEKLKATNQQLRATEQQLRAANQQLEANNQQLIVSEQELKKEKIFSEKIVETASAIIVGLDKDHNIRIFNRGAENITGYKKEEVIGKDWFKIFFPEEMQDEMNKVWKDAWGVQSDPYINPIISKTGEEKIVSWQNTVIYDSDDVSKHLMLSIGEDITKRRQAEEKLKAVNQQLQENNQRLISKEKTLKESEDRLSKTLMAANDGMWDWNLNTNEVYFDPRYYKMADYDVDEFPHRLEEFQKRIHPDDVDYVMNEAQEHLEGKTDRFIVEFRFKKKNGDWLWIQGHGQIVERDEKNIPLRFIGTYRDIFERKQAEEKMKAVNQQLQTSNQQLQATEQQLRGTNQELIAREQALKESEEKFQKIINESFAGVSVANEEGKVVLWNDALEEITGIKKAQTIDRYIWDIQAGLLDRKTSDTKRKEEIKTSLLDILKTGKAPWFNIAMERDYIHPDGTVKRVSGSMYTIKTQKGYLVVSVSNDITERKRAEKKLKESEERFRIVFNNANDMMYIVELTKENGTVVVDANNSAFDLLGYTRDELIGMPMSELDGEESKEKITERVKRIMSGGKFTFESLQLRKDGSLVPVEVSASLIKIAGKTYIHSVNRDITERKQAEAELLKLSTAVKQSPSVIAITDTDGNIEYVNPKFIEITGYSLEEVIGQNSRILKSGEQSDEVYKELWETISSGKTWRGEFHNKKKNGELYWEMAFVSPILDKKGKIINYLKDSEDITERKQAEDNFRHSIDESPLGIRIVNQSGKTIYVNKALLDIYKFSSPDEFLNTKAKERYTEQSYQEHQERKKIRQEGGNVSEYEMSIRQKNGKIRHVQVWRKEVIWNREKHFQVINQDITELKRLTTDLILAKEKAEENERLQIVQKQEIGLNNERMKSLLRISQLQTTSVQKLLDFALEEAIKLTDSKIGYIYFYNETTRQFTLNTWSDGVMDECKVVNPQTVYDLDKTGCWGDAVRQRKPIVLNNYREANPIKKGTPKGHVQLEKFLTIPVIFEEKIVAVAGVANKETDYNNADILQLNLLMDSVWKISERINMIEHLKIAKEKAEESDRLKSSFLANMSHEIRTPMNGILGFTGLLKEPQLTGDEKDQFIRIIEKSGNRMLNTINDIIDISKIEAGQVEVVNSEVSVNEILEEQYNFFYNEVKSKGIELNYKLSLKDNESQIVTDKHKLDGVLTNLIKNAIKFTISGSISFGYETKNRKGKEFLEFYVQDTGIGIPANRIEAIFNRFEQADITDARAFQGSGLGLAISKSYVEMLGGEMSVKSKEDQGTTFTFSIPYKRQNVHESGTIQNKEESGISFTNLSVIIAEDDQTSRMFLETILKSRVKSIIFTTTGKETIEKFRKNPDTDIILMDIKMPDMNGYDATREIRKFNTDVVIIAQTAFGLSGEREKSLEAGCDDYIAKPIKKELLFEKIRICLGKKQS